MNRNTLIILLILSVALNLGFAATIAVRHVTATRAPVIPGTTGFHSWLADGMLDDTQREAIDDIMTEHQDRMDGIRTELSMKRSELMELMRTDEPDPDAVEAKIGEIAELQGELEQIIAEQMMEVYSVLTPEQVERFTSHMEERLCPGGSDGHGGGRGRWDGGEDTDDEYRGTGKGMGKGKGWRNQDKGNGPGNGGGFCP